MNTRFLLIKQFDCIPIYTKQVQCLLFVLKLRESHYLSNCAASFGYQTPVLRNLKVSVIEKEKI